MIKILVCGGREYSNIERVNFILDRLTEGVDPYKIEIIQGGAKGADSLAREWCLGRVGVCCHTFEADWDKFGRAAGPIRNKQMADYGANICVAFQGGNGTENMVQLALLANIYTIRVLEEPQNASRSPTEARWCV